MSVRRVFAAAVITAGALAPVVALAGPAQASTTSTTLNAYMAEAPGATVPSTGAFDENGVTVAGVRFAVVTTSPTSNTETVRIALPAGWIITSVAASVNDVAMPVSFKKCYTVATTTFQVGASDSFALTATRSS